MLERSQQSKRISIQGHRNLKRDSFSHAIIHTNKEEYEKARASRERIRKLENDVAEIKQMLLQLLNK